MVVGAARDDVVTPLHESLGHDGGILLHLLLIQLEVRTERFAKGYGLRRYHVLQRTALRAGKDGRVKQSRHHLHLALGRRFAPWVGKILTHHDYAATRAAHRLVGGARHNMGVAYGILQQTRRYQTRRVSHIYHEDGTNLVGHLAYALVVPLPAVGARTRDDELGPLSTRHLLQLVIVHAPVRLFDVIFQRFEHQTGEVDGAPVAQVTAVAEVEPEKLVARLQAGHEDGHVGLGTRVRLHVGPAGSVHLLETLDGKTLALVNHLAAAVVALARIAFGIFVGENRAHGFQHLVTHKIFTGNQFDAFRLTIPLAADDVKNLRVACHCSILFKGMV